MSAIANPPLSLPARRSSFMQRVGEVAQSTTAAIHGWRARMRQRRELLMLNDIELHDLSLTEADVNREARKPFWETIGLTNR